MKVRWFPFAWRSGAGLRRVVRNQREERSCDCEEHVTSEVVVLSCGWNLIRSYSPVFCFQSLFMDVFFQLCSIHSSFWIFCSLHLCLLCPWLHEHTFCCCLDVTLSGFFFLICFVYKSISVSNPVSVLGKDFRTWLNIKWNLENIQLAFKRGIVYDHRKTLFSFLCVSDFGTHNILEFNFSTHFL